MRTPGSSGADFDAMRAAETKRRRKRAANLGLAIAGKSEIVARTATGILWTPPRTLVRAPRSVERRESP